MVPINKCIQNQNKIIFSKDKVCKFPKFFLDQDEIEAVDDVYLGVELNYNGSFQKAINKQI